VVGLVALLPVLAWPHSGHAQITTDGSLGPARTLSGPSVTIGSGLGTIRGANLFHSFGQFNVNTGQSVTFTGPTSIANVLSRVTGGSPSTIDGPLRSTIPEANMFLLNPSGVLFGPNARLDIGGSFHVTTADYIRFPDGGVFQANLASPTVLSVAPPAAFGFLSANPAPVIVQGSLLEVLPGRSISLVGGDVGIGGGSLRAPGGRMSLIGVGGPGEATFNAATQTPDLALGNGVTGGQITLRGAGLLSESAVRGGRIVIRGGRLVAEQSVAQVSNSGLEDGDPVGIDIAVADDVILDGSQFRTATVSARGADIAVKARSLTVTGPSDFRTLSSGSGTTGAIGLSATDTSVLTEVADISTIGSGTGATGAISITARLLTVDGGAIRGSMGDGVRGGDIVIRAGRIVLSNGGQIESSTEGTGGGSSLTIRATESITASGTDSLGNPSGVASGSEASGAAGSVALWTPTLRLDGGAIASLNSSEGRGGDVTIEVGRAMLRAGAFVTSTTEGFAPAGNVTFEGSKSILITGESFVGSSTSRAALPGRFAISAPILILRDEGFLGSLLQPGTTARSGDVVVDVDRLVIRGGSLVTSSTFGPGAGGTIKITARDSVAISDTFSGGGISTLTAGPGDAGRIMLKARVLTMDGGFITAGTAGDGRGGDVLLKVGRLLMSSQAAIDSSAANRAGGPLVTGASGTVSVKASELINLTGRSFISTVTTNDANAGTIVVSAPSLTVRNGAMILGTTAGAGRGGNIEVNVGQLLLMSGGIIDSTAQAAGAGGTVTVAVADTAIIVGSDSIGAPSRLSSNSQASGPGGNVILRAQNILLQDGGSLQAGSIANGDAGNITVIAGDSFRSFGGSVTTEAANGDGGNIVMTVPRLLHLVDSRVTTSVQGGGGGGGNITIDPQFVILDHSQIQANAFGGPGGNVNVVADTFLSTGSVLSASSALGAPGVINVQAQITDVTGTLDSLPESVLQAAALLRESCRVRLAEGPASSFVLAGRGGLPPVLDGLLPSPLLEETTTAASMPDPPSFSPIVLAVSCR
jgi:filamentous hemagglutinin family protein